MSINWLNKSYGVLDLRGPKAASGDPRATEGQSMLASQIDTRVASLAVEQQTLRTTSDLTQDALKRAIEGVTEDAAEIFARLDQLERSLEGDAEGTLGLDIPPAGAPTDAEYVLGVADVDLPNGRVLVNGVNTTVDYGTPGEVSIDAPGAGAPTDAQYLTAAASAGLSAERVFQSGTNTTFATTPTTAQVNVPNATTLVEGVVQLTNHLGGTSTAPTVRSATTVQTGIVQLTNHLGGTATLPTVRSATTLLTGIVELATSGEVAAGLAVQANDARLSDARTPLAHASTHQHGGGDEVATATPTANAIPKAGAAGTLAANWLPDAILNTKGALRLANDLTGTATAPVVAGIRDNNVAVGALITGQIYRHDGANLVAWSPKYMTATLSANQTTNLAGGNHVEFDTAVVDSGHITLSTGVGQADGIFTLPEGLWMIRLASAGVDFSANTGVLILALRQSVSAALISPFCRFRPYDSASQTADAQNTEGLLDTRGLGSVNIELRIEAGTGSVTSINTSTRVTIFALA